MLLSSLQLQLLQRRCLLRVVGGCPLASGTAAGGCRGLALQASVRPPVRHAPVNSGSSRRWWSKGFLFSQPRGFGKFYPKGSGAKGAKKGGSSGGGSEKASPKSFFESMGERGSGGGGGGGPEPPNTNQMVVTGVALAALLGLQFFSSRGGAGHEINWQEFKTKLLAAGEVERLVVVNKSLVRVFLRSPGAALDSSGGGTGDISSPGFSSRDLGAGGVGESGGAALGLGSGGHGAAEPHRGDGGLPYSGRIEGPATQRASPYFFSIGSVDSFERKLEISQRELGISPSDFVPVQYVAQTNWLGELAKFGPTLLLIGAWIFMMRSMGGGGMGGGGGGGMRNIFRIGKSPATIIKKGEQVGVTFKDVAGCDEAKTEIMEFVDFLKDPTKFTNVGAKIPKGALLCGPPGTGKTLLAKATAGEASVPFFSISGSDFIEMFVGVGPSRVRDLFKDARKHAPCIVFIDEIDAVARQRGKGGFSGGNDERENTLNQLLVEMDGFGTKEGVVVLAGTNRLDILDQAILRPGRFDRQIKVDLPDIKGRRDTFLVHLRELNLTDPDEEVAQRMAALTPGFSGAQIANICNEAAILAARDSATEIATSHFEAATDRVIGGLEKKNMVMTPRERRTVAYHEAGHAGWFLEHADPLLKVTIVPRMSGALGFAQYLPKELRLHTQEQIGDRMAMALGGRAAEALTFDGSITTGASDDLDKVTKMAYSMVKQFGMNERVGQISFPDDDGGGGGLVTTKPYSDETARIIDEEVKKIVDGAYARTLGVLTEHREAVVKIAEYLLENETINQKEIVELIGPRPFAMPQTYAEFVGAAYAEDGSGDEEAGASDPPPEEAAEGSDPPPRDGGAPLPGFAARGAPIDG